MMGGGQVDRKSFMKRAVGAQDGTDGHVCRLTSHRGG